MVVSNSGKSLSRAALAAALVCLCAFVSAQAQVVRPFTTRFTTNDTGDVLLVGNTLISCQSNDNSCAGGRNATGTTLNNNDFRMRFVDVDADATTFNSSRATLTLPAGATVLWAGLYWGADTTVGGGGGGPQAAPNAAQSDLVRFSTPASGYQNITASQINTSAYYGSDYHAFADVTTLVRSGGSGTYAVANVQSGTGEDRQAGWGLVVAYRDASQPSRNMTIFDGFAVVNTTNPLITIPVSGFITPSSGAVNTHVGFISYEGDLGSTGDSVQLNSTTLTNALNPATNFFNSTITRLGSHLSAKNPNYINQLGYDIDDVSASGVLPNGATSATITLRTSASGVAEFYYPGVVAFVTDLYAPQIKNNIIKGVSDINGGIVAPGDVLEYTINVSNTGTDAAIIMEMSDTLPANTTYVAGSLQVSAGANAGAKTDGAGDDQAEYDAGLNRVVFRLGMGASATAGGTLTSGQATTAKFRAQVNNNTANLTVVANQASVSYRGATLGINYTDLSDSDPLTSGEQTTDVTVVAPPNVSLVKSAATNGTPRPGTDITYTVNFGNAAGSRAASALIIADKIPADTEFKLGSVVYDAGTTGLAAPVIEYSIQPRDPSSDDPPNPWINYTPAGASGTYDTQITYVRFRFTGNLNPATSGNISFTVRIR
ncbi:MAG TPA: hypothetical protein VNA19_11675 [Pyrinomonadaceae bacterium]|jgi:uncharacterized repeat protein (TIGR01451 family)|nr:hypothetical protein [Pyrinomonadaceae bacterium]